MLLLAATVVIAGSTVAARADDILRIGMTASDVPTTTGAPNNGFEGVRFLGYPAFEGLVLWDLSPTGKPAVLRPGPGHASRQPPGAPALQGAVALNVSSPSSDVGVMARYFAASSFSPSRVQLGALARRRIRGGADAALGGNRPGHHRGIVRAQRMSGWSTTLPGSTSCTT